MPSPRVARAMLRRAATLAVLFALLAVPAGAAPARAFEGQASACHPVHRLGVDPGALCPRVVQEGEVAPGTCEDDVCGFAVTLSARGDGVLDLRKQLRAEVEIAPFLPALPVCATEGAQPTLACQGEVLATVSLTDGACVEIRVRSVFVELAEVPPSLPIQAENGVTLCREGADLSAA